MNKNKQLEKDKRCQWCREIAICSVELAAHDGHGKVGIFPACLYHGEEMSFHPFYNRTIYENP